MNKLLLTLIFITSIFLVSCGHAVGFQADSVRHEITKDEAIQIAVRDITSRGWREDNIGGVYAYFIEENPENLYSLGDHWAVTVISNDDVIGNHVSIFISKQGEILEIFGGH